MNKCLFSLIVLFSSVFTSYASANIAVSVPVSNPGAETGDLSGWFGDGYRSVNNAVDANTGSHFFRLDSSLLAIESLDLYYARMERKIDLSQYLGRIEKLKVSGWYRNSDLTLRLENFNTGEIISYGIEQVIGVETQHINGSTHFPTGFGTQLGSDMWQQRAGDLSFWGAHWDTYKGTIESVNISVSAEFRNLDDDPSAVHFYDINVNDFDDAYFEWSSNLAYEVTDDFSMMNLERTPVIGFDDIELHLELAPVPVPAGLWLFFTAMTGLVFARKKV